MAVCIINRVNSAPLQAQINSIASQINGPSGLDKTKQNKLVAGNGIVLNNNNDNTTTITNKFANYTGNLNDITYNYVGWATHNCTNKPTDARTNTETTSAGLLISCVNGYTNKDKYGYQVFVSVASHYNGGGIYIRKNLVGVWQPWTRLLQESYTSTGENQDLNNYKFNYMGLLSTTGIVNSPTGGGGLLLCIANNQDSAYRYVYQLFTPANSNTITYVRKYLKNGLNDATGVWSDWSQLIRGNSKGYFTSSPIFNSVTASFISSNINSLTNPSKNTAGYGKIYFFDSKAADYNFDERTWVGAIRPYKWTSGHQGIVFNAYIPKKSNSGGYVLDKDGNYEYQNGYFLGAGVDASGDIKIDFSSAAKPKWRAAIDAQQTLTFISADKSSITWVKGTDNKQLVDEYVNASGKATFPIKMSKFGRVVTLSGIIQLKVSRLASNISSAWHVMTLPEAYIPLQDFDQIVFTNVKNTNARLQISSSGGTVKIMWSPNGTASDIPAGYWLNLSATYISKS